MDDRVRDRVRDQHDHPAQDLLITTPLLDSIAQRLDETGWAAELCSADWTLVHATTQLRLILGEPSDEDLGLGRHVVASRASPVYDPHVARESQLQWLADNIPVMLEATPGGRETLRSFADTPEALAVIDQAEPRQFPAWTGVLDWDPFGGIRYFGLRLRAREEAEYGTIYIYGANLPATLLTLVTRGDTRMFERMARLVEPGRREAAIFFADLQASAVLSRRLPTPTYFELLRRLTSALDDVIIEHGGIVGKHAGDGAVAFFLVDDLGSASGAVRAAVQAAGEAAAAVREAAAETGQALSLNIGLHWGGTLYMGQLVTDGRLEVTALGDEVNECARIQQSARDGAILASKPLVEHLDPADAEAVGVDPAAALYEALGDVSGATEKAARDAGALAVTRLDV